MGAVSAEESELTNWTSAMVTRTVFSLATRAAQTAPQFQRWFLDQDDGKLVCAVAAGQFCLGMPSGGRIFPHEGAAVVLVPRDSPRALRFDLVPVMSPQQKRRRQKQQEAEKAEKEKAEEKRREQQEMYGKGLEGDSGTTV
jgi:hypothetical protein